MGFEDRAAPPSLRENIGMFASVGGRVGRVCGRVGVAL